MSALRRTALWIVRAGSTPRHVEEIEGDLLELDERRRCDRDRKSRDRMLLLQAIHAVLGRPSIGLRRVGVATSGAGVALVAYIALVLTQSETSWIFWLIGLGVAVEVFLWTLMFFAMSERAGQTS